MRKASSLFQKGYASNTGIKLNVESSDYDETLKQHIFIIGIKYNDDFSWKCRKTYQELAFLTICTNDMKARQTIPPMKVLFKF